MIYYVQHTRDIDRKDSKTIIIRSADIYLKPTLSFMQLTVSGNKWRLLNTVE